MATGKQNGTKKKKFDMEATVNSKQQFTGPKATEGSVGHYVNNVRASKDYYDKQEKKKQTGNIMDTSTKGNILHGKLKSKKELKKITDSKEYKDSDYESKTKMLNRATHRKGGSVKKKSSGKAIRGKGCEIR